MRLTNLPSLEEYNNNSELLKMALWQQLQSVLAGDDKQQQVYKEGYEAKIKPEEILSIHFGFNSGS